MRRGSSTSARFRPRFRGTQSGPRPFTRARRSPTPPEPSSRLCQHRKPLLLFDRVEWSHCPEPVPTVRLLSGTDKFWFGSTAIPPATDIGDGECDVGFGSLAPVLASADRFPSAPNSGHCRRPPACL